MVLELLTGLFLLMLLIGAISAFIDIIGSSSIAAEENAKDVFILIISVMVFCFISFVIGHFSAISDLEGGSNGKRNIKTTKKIGEPMNVETNEDGDTIYHYRDVKIKDIEHE